ncbi:hypothetical protein NPS29_15435 [Pseudomonas putida]|uniref:hypothetical protein n=1 Tax=Pseudomonas putida TaxID=303 RepID=UPI0023634E46|nr:hypothetical protein [Pseudomonas putida]MDD1966724.1 hypothetical protein [Pseudomonas putida]
MRIDEGSVGAEVVAVEFDVAGLAVLETFGESVDVASQAALADEQAMRWVWPLSVVAL